MHATLTCLPLCIWLHRNTGVLPMEIQTPVFSNPPPYTHTRMLHSPVYPCVFSCAVTLVYCPWWSRPPCSVTPLHTHTHTHTHTHATLNCLPLCIRLRRNTGVLPVVIQTPMFSNTPHTRTCMLHSPVYHCVFGCTITLVYCPWWSRPPCSLTPPTHTRTRTLHSPVYHCVFCCAVTLVYCPWWSRPHVE